MINVYALPNHESILALYDRYYQQAGDETHPMVSSHWRAFSPRIAVDIDAAGTVSSFRGYGFGDLQSRNHINRIFHSLCNGSYMLRFPYKRDLRILMQHARANLKHINSFLTYDCFRQLCSLAVIRHHWQMKSSDTCEVLLIGDGYGFLASVIKKAYPQVRITVIDIGKVLLFQCMHLQILFPEARHVLFDTHKQNIRAHDFLYVPAEQLPYLNAVTFTLMINIASMQEMTSEAIASYFTFMRAHATQDNLFYCCNRTAKELPGGEVIVFTDYPWLAEDQHLIDELCPFYAYFFSARFPFIHRFDGPFRHRLTRLKVMEG